LLRRLDDELAALATVPQNKPVLDGYQLVCLPQPELTIWRGAASLARTGSSAGWVTKERLATAEL
jgi:hypothetical protein